ncbi:MAG: amino acid decarboxylase, partial [Lachnospiraceae bacterium]|nr:amino acid decarboxylase [Lachnospiraceae bacterium]
MIDLRRQLRDYAGEGWYPFHMPGHKRAADSPAGPDAAIDITEIDGFDDLHHPAGILDEMQKEAARLIGSGTCRFLVNGSTAGILAAVRAAVPKGSAVLVDRRCHLSVYHALILGELVPHYLYPAADPETGIASAPTAVDVRNALEAAPELRAVIITSPSYEGV